MARGAEHTTEAEYARNRYQVSAPFGIIYHQVVEKPEDFRPGDGDSSDIDPFTRKKEDIPSWTTIETSRFRRTSFPVLAIFDGKWLARDDKSHSVRGISV
jgi:hypothetical protein